MPRKKDIFFAVSISEVDSLHMENKPFYNFVCKKNNIEKNFIELDEVKFFKDVSHRNQLDKLISNIDKSSIHFIDNIMLFVDEISHFEKPKDKNGYVYQIFDYDQNKTLFCGLNDVLSYINKKIKNKYAYVSYNGTNEKIEYDVDQFANIMARMTPLTNIVTIAQVKNGGEEDNLIIITPFKLMT